MNRIHSVLGASEGYHIYGIQVPVADLAQQVTTTGVNFTGNVETLFRRVFNSGLVSELYIYGIINIDRHVSTRGEVTNRAWHSISEGGTASSNLNALTSENNTAFILNNKPRKFSGEGCTRSRTGGNATTHSIKAKRYPMQDRGPARKLGNERLGISVTPLGNFLSVQREGSNLPASGPHSAGDRFMNSIGT